MSVHPNPPHDQPPSPVLLSLREAARRLGVSERTIWGLAADPAQGFPWLRIGRRRLIPLAALHEWIERRTRTGSDM